MNANETNRRHWIVSPYFDLCFVVNLWWVFALLPLPASVGVTQSTPLDFFQIYFLTTPHRWITLFLVATDPDRRQGRRGWFLSLAIVAAIVVAAVWSLTGALSCLVLVDFVWNAWHFASQHGGVLRIYGRMSGGGRPVLERWGVRIFVTYIFIRTGLATFQPAFAAQLNTSEALERWLLVDFVVLAIPAAMVLLELINRPWQRIGKVTYLISIVTMYTLILLAIRRGDRYRVISLNVAVAAFHSVEYLAIVTFYAWRRRDTGSESLFRSMSRQWLRVLAVYLVLTGILAHYMDRYFTEAYLALNLWAAYLHYAYDGMIWKLRRPETAEALNVQLKESAKPATSS